MQRVGLGTEGRPVRVAVVGAGPSGFYAANALLASESPVIEVDLFDRLPAPYGLVRGGVAPDHQKIKTVVKAFQKTAAHPRFRFFGNVRIGRDLSVEDLHRHYDQVCFAVGCESSRDLGIPGEELRGSHSATDFVGWYNGHPDCRDLAFDLDVEAAVVVGVGNVAIDVARVLTRDRDELAKTDIADHALEALRRSRVKDVYVVGRRGPAQAAFTPAELKELGELHGVDIRVPFWSSHVDPLSEQHVEDTRNRDARRNIEILRDFSARAPREDAPRRIHLWLYRSPAEVLGEGRVQGLRVEENELVGTSPDSLRVRGTGRHQDVEAGLLLRAVGYRGVPLPGLPFDARAGVVPNVEGRVVDDEGLVVEDTYVVGWAKRGPSGVIGTNRADAHETVAHMISDLGGRSVVPDSEHTAAGALEAVRAAVSPVVTWADWERIDAAEIARGGSQGRIRSKFSRVGDMLDLLGPEPSRG